MEFLGLNEAQQEPIFRILGAVLHLGNIQFKSHEHTKGSEGSVVSNKDQLAVAAGLLHIDAASLAKALTFRHVFIRGQNFELPLKAYEAADARDALAKTLYDKTFQWLVAYINSRITKPDPSGQAPKFIGVLDMYLFTHTIFVVLSLLMLTTM
jgi:myosin heavy subunit